ncbi:MAG: hypothetical protein WA655_17955 [Candidatus Korobacteraceae bacterium]
MTTSMKSLCMAAAVAGMLGGTSIRMQAQPLAGSNTALTGAASQAPETSKPKHSCKGKNACKGQGADGKNSCKGKGSCATDGSKPPMPKM